MKTFKDIYRSGLGLQISFCLLAGVPMVTLIAMAVAQAPYAGNLWLALLVSLTIPGLGIGLLTHILRQRRRERVTATAVLNRERSVKAFSVPGSDRSSYCHRSNRL